MTNKLPESFIKAFGEKTARLNPHVSINEETRKIALERQLSEVNSKLNAARMGGVGHIGKLAEQKSRLEIELQEAMGSRKTDSGEGDTKPEDVEDHVKTPKNDGSKTQAPNRKADAAMSESVKFNGRTFKDYKTFEGEKEANKFLEKNDDYGVIGEKGGKVYVAKMKDMGEKLDPVGKADADIDNDGDVDDSDEYLHKRRKAISKAMKKQKNESVELDESVKFKKGSGGDHIIHYNGKDVGKITKTKSFGSTGYSVRIGGMGSSYEVSDESSLKDAKESAKWHLTSSESPVKMEEVELDEAMTAKDRALAKANDDAKSKDKVSLKKAPWEKNEEVYTSAEKKLDEAIDPNEYKIGSEKSQFGGYRATVKHKEKGTVMYMGSTSYKTPAAAEGEAEAYLKGYAQMGDRTATRYANDYRKKNKKDLNESANLTTSLIEKALSKKQQMAAGAALAAKRGDTDPSELVGASKEMYDSMSEKDLEDFAKTKHKGLPMKKEEVELDEKINKDNFHTSVEKGKFMKSKYGVGEYKNAMFLHDLDNKSGDGKSPMLVTFAKQADAEKAAKQHGGKIIKSGMGTFRIIKEEADLNEQLEAKKGEAKEINGKRHIGRILLQNGKEFAEIYAHSGTSQSKRRGSRVATSQKKVVRWGFRLIEMQVPRYTMTTGFSSRDEAQEAALKAYRKAKGLNEAKSATGYTINHKTFSSAVQHAKAQVEKQGYTIDDDEWDRKVAMGPRKPGKGKTNRYTIELMKDGKPSKRMLQMQVYYDEGRYELNMYIS